MALGKFTSMYNVCQNNYFKTIDKHYTIGYNYEHRLDKH